MYVLAKTPDASVGEGYDNSVSAGSPNDNFVYSPKSSQSLLSLYRLDRKQHNKPQQKS